MQRHFFVTVIVVTSARRPDIMSFNPLSLPLVSYPCHVIFIILSRLLHFLKVTQSSMYATCCVPSFALHALLVNLPALLLPVSCHHSPRPVKYPLRKHSGSPLNFRK